MSKRVLVKTLKASAASVVLLGASLALAGCSTFGMGGFSDPTVTGSVGTNAAGNLNQPMPGSLGATTDVAQGPYVPPANVGGGYAAPATGYRPAGIAPGPARSVSSQDLPALPSSATRTSPAMSAQPSYAQPVSDTATLSRPPVSGGVFMHIIENGESLYTIAKRYRVSVQAILDANGMSSPDKIYVGQAIAIPNRPDLVPTVGRGLGTAPHPLGATASAEEPIQTREPGSPVTAVVTDFPVDSSKPKIVERVATLAPEPAPARPHDLAPHNTSTITAPRPVLTPRPVATPHPVAASKPAQDQARPAAAPTQQTQHMASLPKQPGPPAAALAEPAMSGADKFRWPVAGRVVTDFAASNGTGINIDAPEGTAVRAVENGTVIYVGSGVEGYGNLILIRHANGYVSAYAHLKTMNVSKGDIVNRGDAIGTVGMTGTVSRPQLHFELRKGATPVDPVPLLAST